MFSCKHIPIIFLSPVFALLGSHATADEKVISYPTSAAVQVGVGWDLEKNAAAPNTCITLDDNNFYYDVEKQIKESKLTTGNSEFTLSSSLGISYDESIKESASFAGVGESAHESLKASLKASFDMTKDNSYVLAKQHVITKWRVLNSKGLIKLTPEAQALTTDNFREQCGDGYVSRIEYGGAYYALLNMHTSSYQEALSAKAQFSESVKAHIPDASASEKSSSSVETSLSSSQNSGSLSVTTTEIGGTPPDNTGTNIDTVLDNYSTFPKRVNSDPSEFLMAIVPYPVKSGMGFNNIDAPTKVIYRELVKWKYLSSTIGKLIEEQNSVGSVVSSYFIPGVSLTRQELIDMQKLADAKVDAINSVASSCMDELKSSARTSGSIYAACSLQDKVTSFASSLKPKLDNNNIIVKVHSNGHAVERLPVLESDLPYLVHLPYSSMFSQNESVTSGLSAGTMIFNQVNNIYKHRCLDDLHISNFCESQALVQEAVNKWIDTSSSISSADDLIKDDFSPFRNAFFTIAVTSGENDYYFSSDHSSRTFFLSEPQTNEYSYWTVNADGNLSTPALPGKCLRLSSPNTRPDLVACDGTSPNQRWLLHNGKIMLRQGGNSVISMPSTGTPTTSSIDSTLTKTVNVAKQPGYRKLFSGDYFTIRDISDPNSPLCLQVDGGHTQGNRMSAQLLAIFDIPAIRTFSS